MSIRSFSCASRLPTRFTRNRHQGARIVGRSRAFVAAPYSQTIRDVARRHFVSRCVGGGIHSCSSSLPCPHRPYTASQSQSTFPCRVCVPPAHVCILRFAALRRFGHDRVAVMDGGWAKWQAERRAITPDCPCPLKVLLFCGLCLLFS